jgi:hypothetical protein
MYKKSSWLLAETKVATILDFSSSFYLVLTSVIQIPDGVVVGFHIFAWGNF